MAYFSLYYSLHRTSIKYTLCILAKVSLCLKNVFQGTKSEETPQEQLNFF